MSCEKIQALILTDYLDEEVMDVTKKRELEEHLSSCQTCREFAMMAHKTVIRPFQDVKQPSFSQDFVWQKLKEQIAANSESDVSADPVFDIFSQLKKLGYFLKPRFVVIAAIIFLIFTAVFTSSQNQGNLAQKNVVDEDLGYLVSVIDDISVNADDAGGYGTAIEEYFL